MTIGLVIFTLKGWVGDHENHPFGIVSIVCFKKKIQKHSSEVKLLYESSPFHAKFQG